MSQLIAFTKKELMESIRTGKFWIMIIIFLIFGIMNPAIAKLTPWMLELLSDSLAEQGINVANVTVTALTSWQQFFKNISTSMIVLVIMVCGILVNEYLKGTLVNILTKGMARWKIIVSKSFTVIALWSICYWLCFGTTYLYTIYFWDNSIVHNLGLASFSIYLFGIWLISLIMLGSTLFNSNTGVLLTTGGGVIISYLASLVPTIAKYLPTQLLSAGNMVLSNVETSVFTASIGLTVGLTVVAFAVAVVRFNKKRI